MFIKILKWEWNIIKARDFYANSYLNEKKLWKNIADATCKILKMISNMWGEWWSYRDKVMITEDDD